MRLIKWLFIALIAPVHLYAATIFHDHFDAGTEISLSNGNPSPLVTEVGGNYNVCFIGPNSTSTISSNGAHGGTGRGLYQVWSNGTGTTSEGEIADTGLSSTSYPTSTWVGYWHKISITVGGSSPNDRLKLIRLYAGSVSIIPEWLLSGEYGSGINVYYAGNNHLSGYNIPDTDWHYYIWQFIPASTSSGTDAIIRLYVDGDLAWEDTAVNYGSTSNNTMRFQTVSGNLSGGWAGGTFTTCIDDIIAATTRTEVEDFLGVSGATPAPPTISNATISNGRVQ